MNIKALQNYIMECLSKEIEPTWDGLKVYYQDHKEEYRIA